jgi:cold shock CspA family protein
MAEGYVSYVNHKHNYGFIDSPELDNDHLFFHYTDRDPSYRHPFKGDKVNYQIATREDSRLIAVYITFVRNANLEVLRNDFKNQSILTGFLKKIDDHYFVKEALTHIFIRLEISRFEMNIKENYEDRLNTAVEFKICSFSAKNKIRATILNKQFIPEFHLLSVGYRTMATVVKHSKGGYILKVHEVFDGFLPNSMATLQREQLSPGEQVDVTCILVNTDHRNFVFDLTANIEKRQKFKTYQLNTISQLKPGDTLVGKIKNITSYGIFIATELFDGLLHISEILGEDHNLSKEEVRSILNRAFARHQELEVIISDIDEHKVHLTWDRTAVMNQQCVQRLGA